MISKENPRLQRDADVDVVTAAERARYRTPSLTLLHSYLTC